MKKKKLNKNKKRKPGKKIKKTRSISDIEKMAGSSVGQKEAGFYF